MTDDSTDPASTQSATAGGAAASAPESGKPAPKQRTPKQQAQFEAMRAKRWANKKADQARAAGVDTTGDAGGEAQASRPGAPKVTTTKHTPAPESPEQAKRRAEGKPTPDTSDIEPPEPNATDQAPPAASGKRGGLLGLLADGLGL